MTGASGIEPLDLVAATASANSPGDIGVFTKRLSAGLAALLAMPGATIEGTSGSGSPAPDAGSILFAFSGSTGGRAAHVDFPRALFEILFVEAYGGQDIDPAAQMPTPTQLLFARRLHARLGEWLVSAMPGSPSFMLRPDRSIFEAAELEDEAGRLDGAVVFAMHVTLAGGPAHLVRVRLSCAALAGRKPSAWSDSASATAPLSLGRLLSRSGHVCLPLRSELAGPTVAASRLAALRTGDLLPIASPLTVPVIVAGRQMAEAAIGEWQGTVALRIEKINEGKAG